MALVYAAPARTPSPPVDALQRDGMDLTWTGWDGSVWDLGEGISGVHLLAGTRGLHMPQGTRHRDTSPGSNGSQHRSTIWHEREVFWPIKTWHGGTGPEWMERDRAFWRTMDPDQVGRWAVTHRSAGQRRHLDLRYEPSTPEPGFDTLPSLQRWAHYGAYLVADQPFWVGAPAVMSWKAPDSPGPFFEETGPHLFNIGQGFSFESAAISNLGDIESPPVWYIDGATEPGARVGVGGRIITVPFAVPAWYCLVVDSDPTRVGATMYEITASGIAKKPSERVIGVDMVRPVDRSRDLGPADFAPIPAGKSVPLSISLEGSGVIEVAVPSLYKRAW